jgi:hypothetical protein
MSHHPKQSKSLHAEHVTGFIVAGTDSGGMVEGPIVPALLKLAAPTLIVLVVQTLVSAKTYFVGFPWNQCARWRPARVPGASVAGWPPLAGAIAWTPTLAAFMSPFLALTGRESSSRLMSVLLR